MANNYLSEDVERLRQSLGGLPLAQAKSPLVIVCGLPGTGKSFFCRRLAERLPFVILESDTLRRILFPSSLHNEDENRRLFPACHALVEELLRKGIPVIFDATNLLERHREHLYHAADKAGVRAILVRIESPPGVVQQRLLDREKEPDPQDNSRAGWEVYQRMRPRKEKISRNHFVVDTSRDITPVIDKIVRTIRK